MRYRIEFEKNGRMIYVPQLDMLRLFIRAFNRARVNLEYSEGFRPHARISFSSPLPLFVSSACEHLDVTVSGEPDAGAFGRLASCMPEGILLRGMAPNPKEAPLPDPVTARFMYNFPFRGGGDLAGEFAAASLEHEKTGKGPRRTVRDLRAGIRGFEASPEGAGAVILIDASLENDTFVSPVILGNLMSRGMPSLGGTGPDTIRKTAVFFR